MVIVLLHTLPSTLPIADKTPAPIIIVLDVPRVIPSLWGDLQQHFGYISPFITVDR